MEQPLRDRHTTRSDVEASLLRQQEALPVPMHECQECHGHRRSPGQASY